MAKHKRVQMAVISKATGPAFRAVVERLRSAGLAVESADDRLGLVTGSIDADKKDSLLKVEGVTAAREERPIQISPPPD